MVWRETTAAQWSQATDVGMAVEVTQPMSKDNVFFGVRAYDGDGYRSPVRFMGVGRE